MDPFDGIQQVGPGTLESRDGGPDRNRRRRRGIWLLATVAIAVLVGGYALTSNSQVPGVPSIVDLGDLSGPATTEERFFQSEYEEFSEPTGPVLDSWISEVVDLAPSEEASVFVASAQRIVRYEGSDEWEEVDLAGLPEGQGVPGELPGRLISHMASDGFVLWVAGISFSVEDDDGFGGSDDGWPDGRGLSWVANRCPLCGEWTVWTGNDVPELPGEIGDLVVSSDGTAYASAGTDLLIAFGGVHGDDYSVHHVPLPNGADTSLVVPWSSSLAAAEDGTIWAATNYRTGGVLRFDGEDFHRFTSGPGLPSETISQVAVGPGGVVWGTVDEVGPEEAGVVAYDGEVWTSYTTDDGLLSNNAYIAAGANGVVWAVHCNVPPYGYSRFDGMTWTATEFGLPVGDVRSVVSGDGTLWGSDNEYVVKYDGTARSVYTPLAESKAFTIVLTDWNIEADGDSAGVYGIHMLAEVWEGEPESISGRLLWDETTVELCGVDFRGSWARRNEIGDIFATTEGCEPNPTAMQDAVDEYGLPSAGCLTLTYEGVAHDFCAEFDLDPEE